MTRSQAAAVVAAEQALDAGIRRLDPDGDVDSNARVAVDAIRSAAERRHTTPIEVFCTLDEQPGLFGDYRGGTWHRALRVVRNEHGRLQGGAP